jgi:hypothetical protein
MADARLAERSSAERFERVALSAPISPLELLHPEGITRRTSILGGRCPTRLRPSTAAGGGSQSDLIVLAPTPDECRQNGWLERAVSSAAGRLAPDGLVYALVPPRWRWHARQLLVRNGLPVQLAMLHLPDLSGSRYLVPLEARPALYVVGHLIPTRPARQRLIRAVLWESSARWLLGHWLPAIGLIARRPGGQPLLAWLFNLDGTPAQPRQVVIGASYRGQAGSLVVHRLADDLRPGLIAKIGWNAEASAEPVDEADCLVGMGDHARAAGARVTHEVQWVRVAERPVLTQRPIKGRSVVSLLAQRPDRAAEIMGLVADWLMAWNRSTRTVAVANASELCRAILAPAAAIAPLIAGGGEYRDWLAVRCGSMREPVPRVAAHRDLTAWNLLVDEAATIGVVDWAEAREAQLPLGDFFYAMTDIALWAMPKEHDRLKSFQACFAPNGRYRPVVITGLRQLQDSLGIGSELMELCLHATFVGHAWNEQQQLAKLGPESFLRLVEWLAAHRTSVRRWLEQ